MRTIGTSRRTCKITGIVMMVLLGITAKVSGQEPGQPAVTLESVLRAHRAWTQPPATMEIEGTSRAGENSVPILITATSAGEVAVRTGALHDKKRVTTPTRNFREDTEKITWALAPGGFAQLDVTGLFLLAHAGQSAAKTGPATPVDQGRLKINVHRGRSEVHYGSLKVEDTFDLYLGSNGLLSDISRSFYPKSSSRHYTQLYAFADYRDTAGVLLPYRIAMYHKGKLVHTIEVNNYRFETGADPALFKTRSGL